MAHETTPGRRRISRMVLGSHPLTRGSDRLQVLARVVLLAVLLGSLPIAFAVALATYSDTHRQAAAEAGDRHPVHATLVSAAPMTISGTDQVVTTSRATAVWTTPSGTIRKESVVVAAGTAAGSTVQVWLDRAGHVTRPPLTDSDAVTRAIGHALVTVVLVTTGAFAAFGATLRAIDRRVARRWASEWADVEPLWTRQSS